KLIYSLPDGRRERYRLPDEHHDQPPGAVPPSLGEAIRDWMQDEEYWLIRLRGDEPRRLTAAVPDGRIDLFIPFGIDLESETLQPAPDGRTLSWECRPGDKRKCLLIQTLPAQAPLRVSIETAPAGAVVTNLFVATGPGAWAPAEDNPVLVGAATYAADPFMTEPVALPHDGVFISRYRGGTAARGRLPRTPAQLDDRTREQLRELGYTR
ncbi:hypothetical protein HQ590_16690, partial [bacterium]|nr:hypothetical protein [bacterium]